MAMNITTTFTPELTLHLTNLTTNATKIHIDPSTMLALIPVILAQLSSDFGPLLRIAHDRPCLRWALALTCTRPLSVWRERVHLDDILDNIVEERKSYPLTRTTVLLHRLALTSSVCNEHVVKVLGDVERSKSYSTGGTGLILLLRVLGVYSGMMSVAYHFASKASLLAAQLSLAVFLSQMLTGLFSTYDRQLTDHAGQQILHANRLFARIQQHALFRRRSPSMRPTYESPPSLFDLVPAIFRLIFAGFHSLHTRIILNFPSLIHANKLEMPPPEEEEQSDIAFEARIARWTASFHIPLTEIEEDFPDRSVFVKYQYTFSNMIQGKSGPKWFLGIIITFIRWLRLEWLLILGQLAAWGAIVTGPLRASLWIGLTQTVGTFLLFAGVYFVTLGDSYKEDRILAAFRLADPEIDKGVFLLRHDLAKEMWNGVRHISRAERVLTKIMATPNSPRTKQEASDLYFREVGKTLSRYSNLEKKHREEIESNTETKATCNFYYQWLLIARLEADRDRIHEVVESWELTVAHDKWGKSGEVNEIDGGSSYHSLEIEGRRSSCDSVQSGVPNPYNLDDIGSVGGISSGRSRRSRKRSALRKTASQQLDNIEPLLSANQKPPSVPITPPQQPRSILRRSSASTTHKPPLNSPSTFIDPLHPRNTRDRSNSNRPPRSVPPSEGEFTYASDSSDSSSPPPPPITSTQPSNPRPRNRPQFNIINPTPPLTRTNSNNNLGATQSQPIISSKGNWRNLPDGEENARRYYANKKAQEMEERKMKAVITKLFDGVEDSQDGGSVGGGLFDPQSTTSSTTFPPPSDQPRFPRPSHGRSISLDSIITENDLSLPQPLPTSTTTNSTPHAAQFAPINNQSSLNFNSGGSTPRPTSNTSFFPPISLTTTQQHPLDASQPPNWRTLPNGEENARKFYEAGKEQDMEEVTTEAVISSLFDGVDGDGRFFATSSTTRPPIPKTTRFPRQSSHDRSPSHESTDEYRIALPLPPPPTAPYLAHDGTINRPSSPNFHSGESGPTPTSFIPLDTLNTSTNTHQHPLAAPPQPPPPATMPFEAPGPAQPISTPSSIEEESLFWRYY